jgi:transposase
MAMDRVGMNKLREILRLKYGANMSNRQTAASCRTSHRTVAKYVRLAEGSGLCWENDRALNDTELEMKVLGSAPSNRPAVQYNKIIPDWIYIHDELKRPSVTLQLLWQEYKETHKEAGYEYSFFRELYRAWAKKLSICMRQNHKAGEKAFVDYSGKKLWLTDRATGKKTKTELFVGVWGASNYTYAEATLTQEMENWIMSHVRMFEYSGCVPQIMVPDNLKSGVNDACRYDPEINRTYLELARHYGFTVIPARKVKPKDKAKVEHGVLMAQRWILACLRNRTFCSLREMNAEIRRLQELLNARKMSKLNRSRKEQFETIDKPAALALSEQRYEYALWKKCNPNIDYHVEVAKHYYSVPYQLRHESVYARVTESTVEIFHKNSRITSHVRSRVEWGSTMKPEHMPPGHLAYLDQTPSKMLEWAGSIGENTQDVVKHILESRKYIQQSYRACLGIKRLGQDYGRERLENACRRAVTFQAFAYRNIKAILASGLDSQAYFSGKQAVCPMPKHENIRGEGYYGGDGKDKLN